MTTNKLVTLYTTAPGAHDGHSVREVRDGTRRKYLGKPVRKVSLEERDKEWYFGRCGSGLHAVMTHTMWLDALSSIGHEDGAKATEEPLPAQDVAVLAQKVQPLLAELVELVDRACMEGRLDEAVMREPMYARTLPQDPWSVLEHGVEAVKRILGAANQDE